MSYGFGYGAFGTEPFGEFPWSLYHLYQLLPIEHRRRDLEEGEPLRDFMEALRPLFDDLRLKIGDFGDLRDPLTVRSRFDGVQTLRLGPQILPKGEIEQRGIQGAVTPSGNFTAPRGRFRDRDIGKELTPSNSIVSANNTTVVISSIVSLSEVVTFPALTFNTSDNPLRWELREALEDADDQVTVEVQTGDVSRVTPGWILTDGFGLFEVIARRQFNLPSDERKVFTEQEGRDGEIDAFGRFFSATVVLEQENVGKKLTLAGSETFPDNNGEFRILAIVDNGSGTLVAELGALDGTSVALDADTDLVWAILPRPELDLRSSGPPLGVVEQSGFDGELDPDAVLDDDVFRAVSMSLETDDAGKYILLRGTDGQTNDTIARIEEVLSPRRVRLNITFTLPEANTGSLYWELRPATLLGDFTQVQVRPPSLLEFLAQDFGIELDSQESEARQRSWVRNVHQWLELKGVEKGYEIVAKISGFDSEISQLWRIGQDFLDTVPAANVEEIGDSGIGRSGSDGSLTLGDGRIRFTAPSAQFKASDVGRLIRTAGTASGTNDGLRTIDRFIDAQTVEFRLADTAVVPDANNGDITWSVLRLYTDLAPELPRFDEINVDLLEEIVRRSFVPFDAETTAFAVGEVVTGGTSGATGIVVESTAGALAGTGTLRLAEVTADFVDNETLTGSLGGGADAVLSGDPIAVFGVDRFCWEEDFLAEASITVDSVTTLFPDPDVFEIVMRGPGNVIVDVGNWRFVDRDGTEHFIETVPEGRLAYDGKTNIFTVGQTLLGPQELDYDSFAGAGFAPGNTIVGGTSGATAVIAFDANAGASGTLGLVQVNGIFIDNETLTEGGNTADVDGDIRRGASATITEVEDNGLTGILTLADVRGTFSDNEIISSIIDTVGDGKPDVGTSLGAAVADGDLTYVFTTEGSPPVASSGGLYDSLLRYDCPVQIICDFCPSYVALANIIETTLTGEAGVAVESAFERVLRRLREATPAHVVLAPRFTRTIDIEVLPELTIDDWIAAKNIIFMFLTGLFDLPGLMEDLVPLDVMLKLSKEVPPTHVSEIIIESFGTGTVV